jgi:hypothetical protein
MVTNFSALTLILLSGYIFQISIPPLRIRSSLHNRYHTIFGAAIWGLVIYLLVGLLLGKTVQSVDQHLGISSLLKPLYHEPDVIDLRTVYCFVLSASLYAVIRITGFAAEFWSWNWHANLKNRVVSYAFRRYGSNMLKLVNRAFENSLPVQICLASGKIYIGLVSDTVDPESGLMDFRLIPLESGYRDKETLQYNRTTDYRTFKDLFDWFKQLEASHKAHAASDERSKDPTEFASEMPDELMFTVEAEAEKIEIPGTELRAMADNFGIVIRWEQVVSITIWDKRLSDYFRLTRTPS